MKQLKIMTHFHIKMYVNPKKNVSNVKNELAIIQLQKCND